MCNLEYYRVFYFVAEKKSITLAAEALSVSQPAVSQALKQLEKALGAELFSRGARGVTLTAEGALLYSYVKKGYESIVLGEEMLAQMLKLDMGFIRIGASDMTLRFYLLPFLERFHERYPGIKVNVTNAPTPETLKFLSDGRIDFGIVSTPFDLRPELHAVKVRPVEDVFVAGRRFMQYKNQMLEFGRLAELPLILLEHNTSTRRFVDGVLSENGVSVQPEFELATSDMIVQFALRNLGVGCVMKDFAMEALGSGRLFELRFRQVIPKRHLCVVQDTKRPLSVAARNLLALMEIDKLSL